VWKGFKKNHYGIVKVVDQTGGTEKEAKDANDMT
jgi:hypothetical protein